MAVKSSSKSPGARGTAEPPRAGSPVAAVLLTALGVLVIAACAVLLSYNGIYQIAVQGNIGERYAHLYPAAFTLLVLMAFWTSYVLRTAPRSRRLWVDALIVALIALAAGASALRAADLVLVPDVALVVAAVAPWVALLVAFRLFLWVVMHLRGEIPGTRPRSRRPRKGPDQRADREGREEREERDTDAEPAAATRQQDTQPLDGLLYPEPRSRPQPAITERTHPPEWDDDERPPRPREPEPADFREPGLHTPRPEPAERPTRPEHPGRPASLEPPEHPEPPQAAEPVESAEPAEPAEGRKRRGFFRRGAGRSDATRRRGSRDEAPREQAPSAAETEDTDPAAAPAVADTAHDADTAPGADTGAAAPLWPNATAPTDGTERPHTPDEWDESGERPESAGSDAAPPSTADTATVPEPPGAATGFARERRPEERPKADAPADARTPETVGNTGTEAPADADTAEQAKDAAVLPTGPEAPGAPTGAAPGPVDTARKGADTAEQAENAAVLPSGPEPADHPSADAGSEPTGPLSADQEQPLSPQESAAGAAAAPAPSAAAHPADAAGPAATGRRPADDGPAETDAAAPAPSTPESAAPGRSPGDEDREPTDAAESAATVPTPGAPGLPKRTPGAAENPIKRAADTAPTAVAAADDGGSGTADSSPEHAGPTEDVDGFVHDLPPGDPTSDEAEPATAAPASAAPGEDAGLDRLAPGTDPHEPPRGPAYPAAPPIEKRPMVLKPRRSPRRSAASPFPEDPPSNRVRSEPKPPEE